MENGRSILSSELKSLKIVRNGSNRRLKWSGSFADLQVFFYEVFKISGTWDFYDNCGGYYCMKTVGLSISFYQSTTTLQFQGQAAKSVRGKIFSFINNAAHDEDSQHRESSHLSDGTANEDCLLYETPSSPWLSSLPSSENNNGELLRSPSIVNVEDDDCNQSCISEGGCSKIDDCKCCRKMDNHMNFITNLLLKRFDSIENKIDTSMSNANLIADITKLKARVVALEHENSVIKSTLQSFLNKEQEPPKIDKPSGKSTDLHNDERSKLQEQRNKPQEQQKLNPRGKDKRTNNNEQKKSKHHDNDNKPTTNRKVYVVGDSIVKHLDGRKMSRNKQVHVLSLPGCTSGEMKYHVQPIIERCPEEIIIHVGTNSLLKTRSAQESADEIIHIASIINTNKTKATISSLTPRSDRSDLNLKIESVNDILEKTCKQNNWGYIKHDNILTEEHLNRSRLHLNKKGTAKFAANFIKYLNKH